MDPSALRSVPFFGGLTEDQLASIACLAKEVAFQVGETIFKENDTGDSFYVILSGRVRIVKDLAGGGEEALAILEPGGHFGEMALIDNFPRSASAVAHESCVVSAIAKDAIDQLLFVDRELAYSLLWAFVRTLSQRLRDTNEKLKAFFAFSGGF